jgi:hypothetical protein
MATARMRREDLVFERAANDVGATLEGELLHEAGAVGVDRLGADRELLGDLLARVPACDQDKHLALAAAEPPEAARHIGGGARLAGIGDDEPRGVPGEGQGLERDFDFDHGSILAAMAPAAARAARRIAQLGDSRDQGAAFAGNRSRSDRGCAG